MIRHIVLLGAGGNVTARYLLPALVTLNETDNLPDNFIITAIEKMTRTTEEFHHYLIDKIHNESSAPVDHHGLKDVVSTIQYRPADVEDSLQVAKALSDVEEPVLIYFGLPPSTFEGTIASLRKTGLPKGSRFLIEKPFGESLASAHHLNRLLHDTLPEQDIFRIDHFLGKHMVRNILGLRFANQFFEPIWNHQYIEKIMISWEETRFVKGRASYYDSAGALRDMIQNHLIQLACLVGIDSPRNFSNGDFRDKKVEFLKSIHSPTVQEAKRDTVRARYESGTIDGLTIPAYREQEDVDPDRETETFAQITLWGENARWLGVPFVLRTGKAFPQSRREITVYFRPLYDHPFESYGNFQPNRLRLTLDPHRIEIGINLNGSGDPFRLEQSTIDLDLAPETLPAYAHLLLDALEGDPTLFIQADEAEEAWRIVEPILATWKQGHVPLLTYPAGTRGPHV